MSAGAARAWRVPLALALLAGYALPLLAPPGPVPPATPPAGAPLLLRLFPGVPPAWVALRLLCLAVGAVLAVRVLAPPRIPLEPVADESAELTRHAPGALRVALGLSAAHVLLGFFAERLGRFGQTAYVALLAVPWLILAIAAPRAGPRPRPAVGPLVATAAVIAGWLLLCVAPALHSPRAASPIDTWENFATFRSAALDASNLLTTSTQPGLPNTYLVLLGTTLLRPLGIEPDFAWIQGVQAVTLAGAGAGVAALAGTLAAPWAAPVATAIFLFSPYMRLMPLSPAPFGLVALLAVAMLLCLHRAHTRRSLPALAALGALGGLAATLPWLAPLVIAAGVAGITIAARRPVLPAAAWAVPALVFTAAFLPGMPDLETLDAMSRRYVSASGPVADLESVLFGQRPPFAFPEMWQRGAPGPFDAPLGALLAPFAVARSGIRLLGDATLDPLGAVLAAVGLGLCLRSRSAGARVLLALAGIALLPGFLSAYDRTSLTRIPLLPVAFALLGALGFDAARGRLAGGAWLAGGASLGVALGGLWLFDVVNPRILRASAMSIVFEALGTGPPPGGALVLEHSAPYYPEWLHVRRTALHLPEVPIAARRYGFPGALRAGERGAAAAELLFWSPGLEESSTVSAEVCRAWPGAAFYTLLDRPRLARVYAARPAGPGWTPALPGSRWLQNDCADLRAPEGAAP